MTPIASPTVGAPIWPADWSQFLPDTFSALVAGAIVAGIVGAFLYRWQRGIEARAEERAALSSWRIARAAFARSVTGPFDMMPGVKNLLHVTDCLAPVRELAQNYDIGVWADAAPKNDELRVLSLVLIGVERLDIAAEQMVLPLRAAIMRQGVQDFVASSFVPVANAILLGLEPTNIGVLQAQQFRPQCEGALEDPLMTRHVERFRDLLRSVRADYEALRHSLLTN